MKTATTGLLVVICFFSVRTLVAEDAKIKPVEVLQGSSEIDAPKVPVAVVSKEGLKELWESWKLAGDVPKVDFDKNLVVTNTTKGGILKLSDVKLKEGGDLQVVAIATRDLRPGIRYLLIVVPREGVKTIEGKEIPKE